MTSIKNIIISLSTFLMMAFYVGPAIAAESVNLNPCDPSITQDDGSGFSNLCFLQAEGTGGVVRQVVFGILVIATVVALFFLIWGGFKWLTSGGDKAKVEAARSTIIAAIVGLIIAFLSFFILTLVLGFFGISFSNLDLPALRQ